MPPDSTPFSWGVTVPSQRGRAAPQLARPARAGRGYWWCPNCERQVPPMQVDWQEVHVLCGHRCETREDIAPQLARVVETRAAIMENLHAAETVARQELIRRLLFVLRMPTLRLQYVLTMIAMQKRDNDEDSIFG